MTAKNERIDVALLVGERSERYGSGDVGRAVHVLCAAVEQQEALGPQGDVGLGRRFVVNDGTVLLVGGDGVEGESAVERLFGAQVFQFLADRKLGLSALGDGGTQPAQESGHGDAVAQHRLMKTPHLAFVLHGFHLRDGRLGSNDFARDALVERVVHLVGVEQDVILEVVAQSLAHVRVVVNLHSLSFQVGQDVSRHLHLIYI